jgi:hypothetical protein
MAKEMDVVEEPRDELKASNLFYIVLGAMLEFLNLWLPVGIADFFILIETMSMFRLEFNYSPPIMKFIALRSYIVIVGFCNVCAVQ